MRIHFIISIFLFAFIATGCSSPQGIFGNKSAHQKYLSGLEDAGLSNTGMARKWKSAAENSLSNPLKVNLPYRETGYFEKTEPRSAGYSFSAKRGERVLIDVQTTPARGFLLFVELWTSDNEQKNEFLIAADTLTNKISWDVKKEGRFVVRMQPELLQGFAYTINISTGPSLAFPIQKNANPKVISVWGDARDGNSRKHEGIDILAKKFTPVVAAADGTVTSVKENGLGGKVVFLRPEGMDFNLYYAHLDSQLVRTGQRVRSGDPLGTVGNTGNAKNTVAHLHFGIYTGSGAIDPLPFVNDNRPAAKSVSADTSLLSTMLRLKSNSELIQGGDVTTNENIKLTSGQALMPIAAASDQYYVVLPTGEKGFIHKGVITAASSGKKTLNKETSLYDSPANNAAVKKQISKGETITFYGTSGNFSYISAGDTKGWVSRGDLD